MDYVQISVAIKISRLLLFHANQMTIGSLISLISEHPEAPTDRKAVNPREIAAQTVVGIFVFIDIT
jgi:hypothetical protein